MSSLTKKKVLVLTSTFPRWEEDNEPPFVFELCKRLLTQYDCTVLAPHYPGSRKRETMDGIQVVRFQYLPQAWQTLAYNGGILAKLKEKKVRYLQIPFFLFFELIATIKFLRSGKYDFIHAHWIIPHGFIALMARKFLREFTPLLCTLHGGDLYSLRNPFLKKLKKYILNHSNRITVVSTTMKNDLINIGIDVNKIEVIPMGVDLKNSFIPYPKSIKKPYSILFAGRLVEKKGVKYLIQALPSVIKKYPNTTLSIVGSGPESIDLMILTKSLKLDNNIIFTGNINNKQLPKFYNEHSIVIFPFITAKSGDKEGFGLVLVEALGCECAVITSKQAAVSDIVTHEYSALVVESRNSLALSNTIQRLFEDKQLARKLGRNGRNFVIDNFDWESISKRYCMTLQIMENQ